MTNLPDICVVDVNVGVAANGKADVCIECELECVETLETIMATGRVAIDDHERIWSEYMAYLHIAGEPGMGDQFLRWVHENQWNNGGRCETIPITPTDADPLDFDEFPRSPALYSFDRSDRKYVAVAIGCGHLLGNTATILHATDRGWWNHEAALAAEGITVVHLCPDEKPD